MRQKLKEIWGRTDDVLEKYAFVLLASFVASFSFIVLYENLRYINGFSTIQQDAYRETNHLLGKISLTSALGISLLFALNMWAERIGNKLLLNIVGLLFLVGFYFVALPKTEEEFTIVHATIIIISFILSHLLVAFLPFLKKENPEINFWQYNKNLFINIVLTAIFTLVLIIGINLAIFAVNELFRLKLNDKIYIEILSFFAIFGSSFIFLLFNEEGLSYLERDDNYPQILKFFTQFILIPLLIIYCVILYFYMGDILLKRELPRGWVSYLILAYSIVGIFSILLVFPLKSLLVKTWVKGFSKIFYYTLLPLLVLLFIAIFTRILEYGYTENRYLVLILAVWLSCMVLYFIFYKKASIKMIPISLFLFGLFALIFPFLNAFSVAKTSQKNELEKILAQEKLLENGKINFAKPIKDSIATQVSDKFVFLSERRELEYLMNFLEVEKATQLKKDWHKKCRNRFAIFEIKNQFTNIIQEEDKNKNISIVSTKNTFETKDYDWVVSVNPYANEAYSIENSEISLSRNSENSIYFENPKLVLKSGNQILEYPLNAFFNEIINQNANKTGRIEVEEISHEVSLGAYQFKICLENIELANNKVSNVGKAIILAKKK